MFHQKQPSAFVIFWLIHQKIIQSKQTGQNNLSQNLRKTEVDPLEDQSELKVILLVFCVSKSFSVDDLKFSQTKIL